MKAKVTRSEFKECVKNALERVLSEKFDNKGKKWEDGKKTKSDFFDTPSKHEKAKKGQFGKKEKGNKGNRDWSKFSSDED